MRILITTGIYPPQIGGPAQYAKNVAEAFGIQGQSVSVVTYGWLLRLPSGIRHIAFFLKILPMVCGADVILALDTFSVGLPSVFAGKLFGKKVVIRTGGDFLWEGYVERTGKKVLLRDFYKSELGNFNIKEKKIFSFTKWALKNASRVVFSTTWQREIWQEPYGLDMGKTEIVENYYGQREVSPASARHQSAGGADDKSSIFVGFTRKLKWKNLDILERAFTEARKVRPELVLDLESAPYEEAMEKMKHARCAILVSLGDISPNFVLDAVRLGVPVILTKENGIVNRVGGLVRLVDPLDTADITKAILEMVDDHLHVAYVKKIEQFQFTHTWEEIATEFSSLFQKIL